MLGDELDDDRYMHSESTDEVLREARSEAAMDGAKTHYSAAAKEMMAGLKDATAYVKETARWDRIRASGGEMGSALKDGAASTGKAVATNAIDAAAMLGKKTAKLCSSLRAGFRGAREYYQKH